MQPIPIRPRLALLRPLDPPAPRPADSFVERRMAMVLLNMITIMPFVIIGSFSIETTSGWVILAVGGVSWSWMATQYLIGRGQ